MVNFVCVCVASHSCDATHTSVRVFVTVVRLLSVIYSLGTTHMYCGQYYCVQLSMTRYAYLGSYDDVKIFIFLIDKIYQCLPPNCSKRVFEFYKTYSIRNIKIFGTINCVLRSGKCPLREIKCPEMN